MTVDIFKHTAKKNKKIKRVDQILPEVYGTTLRQSSYDQYVQLIIKSYLPVVYGTTLNTITHFVTV
jgi:hypothetical protein